MQISHPPKDQMAYLVFHKHTDTGDFGVNQNKTSTPIFIPSQLLVVAFYCLHDCAILSSSHYGSRCEYISPMANSA